MPVVAPPPPPQPPAIVVQSGDNLWKIAKGHSPTKVAPYFRGLLNANPLPNPSLILVGQKLKAPTAADIARPLDLAQVAKVSVTRHAAAHPIQRKVHRYVPVEKHAAPVAKYVPKHSKVYKHSAAGVARAAEQRAKWFAAAARAPVAAPAPRVYHAPVVSSAGTGACGGALPPCYVLKRESGGNPLAENPTSTASGLWQFVDGTWNGYGGYSHASQAPPSVQNARAAQLWAGGAGCGHWMACG